MYGLGWHGKDGTPGKEGVCNEQTERSLSDCTSTVTTSHTMPAHRCASVRTLEPRLLQVAWLVYIETCALNTQLTLISKSFLRGIIFPALRAEASNCEKCMDQGTTNSNSFVKHV